MARFQLVRLATCPGNSLTEADDGFCRFHPPLKVMLNACPVVDDGGLKSSAPKTRPWSFVRSVGMRPAVVGTPSCDSAERSRMAESGEPPAAISPTGSVLSKL